MALGCDFGSLINAKTRLVKSDYNLLNIADQQHELLLRKNAISDEYDAKLNQLSFAYQFNGDTNATENINYSDFMGAAAMIAGRNPILIKDQNNKIVLDSNTSAALEAAKAANGGRLAVTETAFNAFADKLSGKTEGNWYQIAAGTFSIPVYGPKEVTSYDSYIQEETLQCSYKAMDYVNPAADFVRNYKKNPDKYSTLSESEAMHQYAIEHSLQPDIFESMCTAYKNGDLNQAKNNGRTYENTIKGYQSALDQMKHYNVNPKVFIIVGQPIEDPSYKLEAGKPYISKDEAENALRQAGVQPETKTLQNQIIGYQSTAAASATETEKREAKFYWSLFNACVGNEAGYTVNNSLSNKDYFYAQLKNGNFKICDTNADTNLLTRRGKDDEVVKDEIDAWEKAEMNRCEIEESELSRKLTRENARHMAIETEISSIQSLLNKAIENAFVFCQG